MRLIRLDTKWDFSVKYTPTIHKIFANSILLRTKVVHSFFISLFHFSLRFQCPQNLSTNILNHFLLHKCDSALLSMLIESHNVNTMGRTQLLQADLLNWTSLSNNVIYETCNANGTVHITLLFLYQLHLTLSNQLLAMKYLHWSLSSKKGRSRYYVPYQLSMSLKNTAKIRIFLLKPTLEDISNWTVMVFEHTSKAHLPPHIAKYWVFLPFLDQNLWVTYTLCNLPYIIISFSIASTLASYNSKIVFEPHWMSSDLKIFMIIGPGVDAPRLFDDASLIFINWSLYAQLYHNSICAQSLSTRCLLQCLDSAPHHFCSIIIIATLMNHYTFSHSRVVMHSW